MNKKRKIYTCEFKTQAIALVKEANRSAACVARERWSQCIGQLSSVVKDKFWLLNYAANIKLSGCNTPL